MVVAAATPSQKSIDGQNRVENARGGLLAMTAVMHDANSSVCRCLMHIAPLLSIWPGGRASRVCETHSEPILQHIEDRQPHFDSMEVHTVASAVLCSLAPRDCATLAPREAVSKECVRLCCKHRQSWDTSMWQPDFQSKKAKCTTPF